MTPFLKPHSTEVVGLRDNPGGDDRYYNNLFVGRTDLSQYEAAKLPTMMDGNVFLNGSKPSKFEKDPVVQSSFDLALKLLREACGWQLDMKLPPALNRATGSRLVTTELLGKAVFPDAAFEQPDGSPYQIGRDYFDKRLDEANPGQGPFENSVQGSLKLKVW